MKGGAQEPSLLSCHLPFRAMSQLQVPLQVKKETPAPLALLSRPQATLWRGARPPGSLLPAFPGLFAPSSPSSGSEHAPKSQLLPYSLRSACARSKGGLEISADHPLLGGLWGFSQPSSRPHTSVLTQKQQRPQSWLNDACCKAASVWTEGSAPRTTTTCISILDPPRAQHGQGRTSARASFVFLLHSHPEAVPRAPGAGGRGGTAAP